METLLINEEFISQFKFWLDGQVQQGMTFRDDLFGYVAEFKNSQRHEAFDLTWKLSQENGQQVVVTATRSHYRIWLNLRSTTELSTSDSALDGQMQLLAA
jgi:hypothetical protein